MFKKQFIESIMAFGTNPLSHYMTRLDAKLWDMKKIIIVSIWKPSMPVTPHVPLSLIKFINPKSNPNMIVNLNTRVYGLSSNSN
jgi:hypothetical protein